MNSHLSLAIRIIVIGIFLLVVQNTAMSKDLEFEVFSLQDKRIKDSIDAEVLRRLADAKETVSVEIVEHFDPDSGKNRITQPTRMVVLSATSKFTATVSDDAISLDVRITMPRFDEVDLKGLFNTDPKKTKGAQLIQVVMPKSMNAYEQPTPFYEPICYPPRHLFSRFRR